MRRSISQLRRPVLPFGACHSASWVSSGSTSSSMFLELHRSSYQALCYVCRTLSSVTDRRPLLWQDYFPHSSEHWECAQALTNAEYQVIKESLEISHDLTALHGIKVAQKRTTHNREYTQKFLKRPQISFPEVSHVCKKSSALEADDVFTTQLPSKDIGGDMANILNTLGMLDEVNEPLSADDFIFILQKCRTCKDLVLAKHVHKHIRRNGFETHKAVGNHLVPLFVECGSVVDAQDVFDRLPSRNVYSWTSLLLGYIQHGQLLHVMKLYEKMQVEGIPPSSYTLVALVKVCTALRDMERGRTIYICAVQHGFESQVIVGSTLIDMYTKSHSLAEAQKVFDRLSIRNVVAWSALIAGYAELGDGKAALKCFEQMQVEGVFPNAITYISILKACSSAGLIKRGQDFHTQIVDKGFERDLFVGNTLIDMYAKGGSVLDARGVFEKLPVPDVSSWNVMIQGYSMNHDNTSALQIFESMRSLGVKPDAITFACVLSTCSRANLVVKGQELFKMMREVYNIVPSADHLNCMVDLLARAGGVCEAEKLLDSSPSLPSLDTWRALLSACKKYSEVETGERCFYKLIQMNPESAARVITRCKVGCYQIRMHP